MDWIDVNKQMPDADETVLLFMPDAEGEPVWPGYFECYGDCSWLLADGMPAGRVTHWMSFPEVPEKLTQSIELKAALRALAEAQKAADFNFEQYQDAAAELFKTAEQHDDLLKALETAKQKMESATKCHPNATAHLLAEAHEVIDAAIASAKGGV